MNQNKKWYSLFLVLLISISTVIQPLQAVAAVTAMETMATEAKVLNEEIDTTQAEGVVEETEESTEEVVTSSSSEVVEESISSEEAIHETEESTEVTVESTTEEKEVKKLTAKKEVEDRESIDIKTLLNGEKFLTDVAIKITDKDGKELDYKTESIPLDALVSLKYNYKIPEHLLTDKKLKAGDYYDITIPAGININAGIEGKLGNYGTYKVVDGKVRLTFNKSVETLFKIEGDFTYNERLDNTVDAGENEIRIPLDGEDQVIKVNVKPTGGNPISKQSSIGDDKKSVQWSVSINNNLETLNNATVTDKMPEGLELKGIKIYEQTINKNGTVKSVSDSPISEDLYTVSGDVITFKGQTNKSYKIVYDTVIEESKIPETGGNVSFKNNATLTNNGKDYPASASATLKFGMLIQKKGPSKDDRFAEQVYRWRVEYNHGNKDLPKGSYIVDTLSGDNQQYVTETPGKDFAPVQIWVDGGAWLERDKDYVVEYIGNNQMKISFPNGLDKPVNIEYFTKIPFVIDDSNSNTQLKNGVKTDSGVEHSAGGGIQNNGMQKKSDVDYENRKISWSIDVNIYQYEMANWELKDTMSEGLTFIKDSLEIQEANGPKLVLGTDYELVSSDDRNFHVRFKEPRSVSTNKSYTISYQTDFDYRRNDLTNTATSYWKGKDGKDHKQSASNKPEIGVNFINDATKGGSYNAVSKEITWTIKANYNLEKLKNATIVDTIPKEQEYIKDSAHVYEATISKDGTINRGAEVKTPINLEGNKLTAELPEGSKKAYILEFKTSLEGTHISKGTCDNTATYKTDSHSTDVSSSVTVPNGGEIVNKEGQQAGNYVNWSVDINKSQSTIHDLVLVDTPSTNQVLDEKSIVIYETQVNSAGEVKKVKTTLAPGVDYKYELTTDNETGQQVLTIKFLKVVKNAYVLEYRSLINTNKASDDLTNTISYTGQNVETISDSKTGSAKVITSGGSGSGTAAALRVLKLDANNEIPLEGVQFELWAADKATGEKLQVVRSGETNKDGELKFANLMPDADYVLVETKAPEGYTISKENRNGIRINLKDTGEINLYETHIVKNDIPRLEIKKVDADGQKALADAEFAIQNEAGQYYNGINDKYEVKWVKSLSDVSKEVSQSLISDANGLVKVAGLNVGKYKVIELKAPKGYDKLLENEAVEFEVIDENGYIHPSKDIVVQNKKYETTSITINKTWDDGNDQDGERPESITFNLLANGKVPTDEATPKEITLTEEKHKKADNTWSITVDHLRKKDDAGKDIVYSLEEQTVKGYEKAVIEGFEVTNKRTPALTEVKGTKTWNDKDNQDGKRPQSISVTLFANGKEVKTESFNGLSEDKKDEVNPESTWSYEFTDLPKYEAGAEIKYTVVEKAIENYSMSQEGNDFTNSYTPGKTSVSVSKVWNDDNNRDSKRLGNVEVKLFKHTKKNETKVDTGKSVTLSEKNNWTDSFTDLDVYQPVGEEIIYTVEEVPVANGYTSEVTGNAKDGYVVTNTRPIEKISLKGKKTWDDGNNRDGARLESITVTLLADGKPALDEHGDLIEPVVVTGGNTAKSWSYEFKDVPKNQVKAMKKAATKETEKATPIVYTVEEEVTKKMKASNYAAKEESEGSMNITNVRDIDTVDLEGTKTWSDKNNRDNARPKSIKIHLLADGEPALDKAGNKVDPITVTGNNTVASWNYEFKEMPKNRAVKAGEELKSVEPIVYTVKEELAEDDKSAGYTATEDSMNVTNERDIETVNLEGTKTWKDNNNRDNVRPKSIKIHLLADGEPALDEAGKAIQPITVTGNNTVDTWNYAFTKLPKHRAVKAGDTIKKAEPITYTVKEEIAKEDEAANYEIAEDVMNVTNTRPIDKVSLKGTKTWADFNNQDGKRPESIKVYLLADGQPALDKTGKEIEPITVKGTNTADSWNYEFKDVPKHRAVKAGDTIKEATPISYTIKEEVSKELINEDYAIEEDGMNVTNTRPLDKVSFKGTKVWDDANNQDGIRPENITVNLFADGEKVASQVVTGSRGFEEKDATWSYEFKDLPKHAEGKVGKKIKYTVTEEKIANYETKVKGSTITNSYKPQETRLFVEKAWDDASDQDGKRPQDIAIQLYADGKALTGKKLTLSSANKWKASIKNLPVKFKGEDIKYSVKEISEAAEKVGYKAKIAYSVNKENKQNKDVLVTNSRAVELTSISGNKTWNDANNQDGMRTDEVTINLLADGKKIASQKVNAESNWAYSFTDLPVYKVGEVGQKVVYSIEEEAVEKYEATITKTDNGFDVENTHAVELTEIKGNKIWNDANNQDGIRPEKVTFNLLANGEKIDSTTADEKSDWTYEFTNLPVYEVGKVGQKVTYTVEEEAVKGYESTKEGNDFTNTHAVELTEIKGNKIWNDANNQDGIRPEKVTINLLANGEKIDSTTADEKSDWTYEFTNLPVYEVGKVGQKVTYTVEEEAVKGYESTKEGNDFTNTHKVELISIPVKKIWNDANNKDGIRPNSITVNLFADGEAVKDKEGKAVVVTFKGSMDTNEWSYEFKDLPKFKAGKEIEYSVTENKVDGYKTEIKGFTITNTHVPKESGKKPTGTNNTGSSNSSSKGTTSKTGSLPKTGEAETSALVNLGMAVLLVLFGSNVWFARKRKLD